MIHDIAQPLFECQVYPGDPAPEKKVLMRIREGADCNLTGLSMCAHNGTHVDAPYHFLEDGKTIDRIRLEKLIGPAWVTFHPGEVTAGDAERILREAREVHAEAWKRILIGGQAMVTEDAARVFADAGIDLIGNESQTVGPENAPMRVHLILLKAEVVLLEGIRLTGVPEGVYLLNCAPLNLTGADGAPCRAVLLDAASCGL